MADYDLAIIGAGTGNGLIVKELDGWKIAIIEKSVFGGTCLNRGCIPTKMLVHAADCLLYTSPSPRDATLPRMPSSA